MTVTVSCPSCDTSFPVDPAKVPPEGVRAQCSNCPEIFDVDRPSEATPEATPATESTTDTIEASDSFDFTADRIAWHDHTLSLAQITDARDHFAVSFGSCSFDEPRDDLRELNLL